MVTTWEKTYAASGSRGLKPGKGTRKVNISKITPPTSPPSRTFGLSPPHADPGKRKEDDVEVEQVGAVVVVLVLVLVMVLVVVVMVLVMVLRRNLVRLLPTIPFTPRLSGAPERVELLGLAIVRSMNVFRVGLGIPTILYALISPMPLDGTLLRALG
ncbi:hypothetical protein Hdeb2414_s0001g00014001 [Helianthus debilis subsp. tardiflorus]